MLFDKRGGYSIRGKELEKRTTEILQQHQLSYFDKQSPLPQFKAVGDDEGLFIIVPANRSWYPTAKASGIFPEEVRFETEGQEYKLIVEY